MDIPLVVSIAGDPKTGKSHLMLTFPDPMLVFSFDIGLEPVAKKFPDKKIEVKTYPIPIVDTLKPKPYARAIWNQFVKDFTAAIDSGKYKTIGIDTSTNLYSLAKQCYTEELGQQQLLQFQYGEVYTRLGALYNRARLAGVNLVITHYLADEYINNAATGKQKLDGWKGTEAAVDVALWTRRERRAIAGGDKKNFIVTTVKDNRFDLDLNEAEFDNLTYADLMLLLGA